MQDLLANVDHIKFDLEIAVEQQLGAQPLPFPGMDSKCWDASWYSARCRLTLSGINSKSDGES